MPLKAVQSAGPRGHSVERDMHTKDYVSQTAPKKVKYIQFQPLSPQQIVNMSEFECNYNQMYDLTGDGKKVPAKWGVLDNRLGVSHKGPLCETCHLDLQDCVGHFAYIKLQLPVYHLGYFKHCMTILQDICKTCSRVLLTEENRRKYLRMFRKPDLENIQRAHYAKMVNSLCRKVLRCPYCTSLNGTVKKAGALKITHERFRASSVKNEFEDFKKGFANAIREERIIGGILHKAYEDIHALRCLELFKKITPEDCELLGLNPEIGRPEDYIWQYISVPAVCIRPSVQQEGQTNEDDLTVKLVEILWANTLLIGSMQRGEPVTVVMEQWEFMQNAVALYINADAPGMPPPASKKPVKGLCQRLKGKQGRFRGNLSGKRVDFSGRTVIGPDPNLRIDEVAIPRRVAEKLTYPERVTDDNIAWLRKTVCNGAKKHPGANGIRLPNGSMKWLSMLSRDALETQAKRLQVGDIVERHLIDGDIVLFNRQPSLHKLSIMCHKAKIRPWRTFRLNECACNPYNADFDGDEMNLHVPQTEEARTEALELMSVKKNIVTPRNGEPIIAAIQDFITASFLLSRRDRMYNRQQFTQICGYFGDAKDQITLPPPTIWKPVRLWTGKQVFNLMMRPNKQSKILVNLEAKCRTLDTKKDGVWGKYDYPSDMAPNDGYLVIVNSEIMCGVFDKNTVGDGKKNSVFGVILRDYGTEEASKAMNRLAKLSARWLANLGFSLGINDVMPGPQLRSQKEAKVEAAYLVCDDNIEKAKLGLLDNDPGCDQEMTLEHKISGVLSGVREAVGGICMSELSRHNAPLIMATCGSKGSKINVAQMVACVGQQIIAGNRVPDGFHDRSLPHFPKKNREPASKGFVRSSFFSGLSPTEFLFHAISGREGLVDTAVKTAETGYMARRLMKALEDLSTQYDSSVRNSTGNMVQFRYGDDNLDPACLEGDASPVEYVRTLSFAMSIHSRDGRGLYPFEIRRITQETLDSPDWRCLENEEKDKVNKHFRNATYEFIEKNIVIIAIARRVMFNASEADDESMDEYVDALDADLTTEQSNLLQNFKITEEQLRGFLAICYAKYLKAIIEPGSTVGAVGAQSIGEPGTQMTLKTFHFAGVAAMNVTLGVPRIKEIINAAKTISTPIITGALAIPDSEPAARIVKGRVEKTLLSDVASVIEENWGEVQASIGIHIDFRAIQKLQLELSLTDIQTAIIKAPKLKIAMTNVQLNERLHRLRVYIDGNDKYHRLKALKRALPHVVVKGLPSIARAIISEIGNGNKGKQLLVEGYGLKEVMAIDGIVGTKTKSNHVMDMARVLGIEAARKTIYDEIQTTMISHGMSIDPRHVMLLGDTMTYKGEVLGITRHGISRNRDSTLMLASFEKTTDHLFDAALYSKSDRVDGVSEAIIMGTIAPNCGTSMAALVMEAPALPPKKTPLFEQVYKRCKSMPAADVDMH